MVEKISVRIGLEGGEEVEKQLADVGKAGEDAFKQIEQASTQASFDKVADDISKAGLASEKTAEKITELGGATTEAVKATDGLAQAQSNLTLQSAKTVAEIGKLAVETAKTGVETYKLITKHESWIGKLIELGTNATKTSGAIGVLSSVLGPYGKIIAIVAGVTLAASQSTEALGAAAEKTAKPFVDLTKTLRELVLTTGESPESLQQMQALFGQLGVSAETFRSTIAKLFTEMANLDVDDEVQQSADALVDANKKVLEAEKAVTDARAVGAKTPLTGADGKQLAGVFAYVEGLKQIAEQQTKAKEAADKLAAANAKVAEVSANSFSKVLEQVQAIEQGEENIKFDSLVKADTIAKALAVSLQQAAENGENAGQMLLKFIATADRMHALEIGKKFGLSEQDVEKIRLLGGNLGNLDAIWKRIQGAGVLIPPETAEAFKKLSDETIRYEAALARLAQAKEGSIFATLGAQVDTFTLKLKTGLINVEAAIIEFGNMLARISWDSLTSGFMQVAQALGYVAIGLGVVIGKIGELAAAAGGAIWEGFKSAGSAAIEWIGGKLDWIIEKIKAVAGGIGGLFSSAGGGSGGTAPQFARGGLIGGRGSGTSDSNLAWVSRGEYIIPARVARQPGVLAFLEALRGGGKVGLHGGIPAFADGGSVGGGGGILDRVISVISDVMHMIDSVSQSIGQLTFTMVDGMRGVMGNIDSVMRSFSESTFQMVQALKTASDTLFDFKQELERASGHASGGLLGGRGSGTSDSNLAWVSRGEHIMPAYAVRQPGVLSFLEALRRSGGNLSQVLNGLGRYAAGGLVMPSLATASTGGGMSNVTIQFPGLPAIGGLRASSQVVEELQRAAAMAQVRSGGRKPSRYR